MSMCLKPRQSRESGTAKSFAKRHFEVTLLAIYLYCDISCCVLVAFESVFLWYTLRHFTRHILRCGVAHRVCSS